MEPEDKEPYLDSFTKEHPHYYNPLHSTTPSVTSNRPWNYTPLPLRPKPLPKREFTPRPESPSEKVAFDFQGIHPLEKKGRVFKNPADDSTFCFPGQPIYTRGGLTRRPLSELLEPNTTIPWASIVRDPWWWEYPELRPYKSPYGSSYSSHLPFYLRDSYLSPIKRQYLWTKHPIRPFCKFCEMSTRP